MPDALPKNSRNANKMPVTLVITVDNNLITTHRIGWIIWICQIITRIGHHISKAKSVRI